MKFKLIAAIIAVVIVSNITLADSRKGTSIVDEKRQKVVLKDLNNGDALAAGSHLPGKTTKSIPAVTKKQRNRGVQQQAGLNNGGDATVAGKRLTGKTSKTKPCREDNNSKGCKPRNMGWVQRTWVTCHGFAVRVGTSAWDGMTWTKSTTYNITVEMFGGAWRRASQCLAEIDWGPIRWMAEYTRDAAQDGFTWFRCVTCDGLTRLASWIWEGVQFMSERIGNLYSHYFQGTSPVEEKRQKARDFNNGDATASRSRLPTGKTSKTKTCRGDNNSKGCKPRHMGWVQRTWVTCHGFAVRVGTSAWDGITSTGSKTYNVTVEMFAGAWKRASHCLAEVDWGGVVWMAECACEMAQDGLTWLFALVQDGCTRLASWIWEGVHFMLESVGNLYRNYFKTNPARNLGPTTWKDTLVVLFVVNLVFLGVYVLATLSISSRTMPFKTLETTNFPLYAVNVLDREHFLIAGGGGAAKTGVPNALNIYKLGTDGKELKASLVHNFEAGRRAIMNCAIHPTSNILAVGMDTKCQILELDIQEDVRNAEKVKGKNQVVVKEKTKKFVINELQSKVTVSAEDGDEKDEDLGFQKVVRFTADGKHIVTGGSDGHVKVLKYPSLECVHDIKAHSTDVDDLDVHPNSNSFVTCSRDTTAYVWRLDEGRKQFQLYFSANNEQDNFFRIRACRFGCNERKDVHLFTINVPAKFNRKTPTPSYLVKWDCSKWLPQVNQAAGIEPLTQMAVSGNGTFVGVGTAEGDISVYIAWNLAPLVTLKGVHNIFVTGLTFLPDSPLVSNKLRNEFALLSISADNTCKVTSLKRRSEYSLWWILVGFLFLLYLSIMALAYAGFDL